jgi:hypothetical protein
MYIRAGVEGELETDGARAGVRRSFGRRSEHDSVVPVGVPAGYPRRAHVLVLRVLRGGPQAWGSREGLVRATCRALFS